MYKKYSDGTLLSLPKKELLLHLRAAEHNRDVAEQTLEQQAKNMKDWLPVRHGHWVEMQRGHYFKCSLCRNPIPYKFGWKFYNGVILNERYYNYCPDCGAKMDEEVTDNA